MNKNKPKSVDEYIALQPEFQQELLFQIRKIVKNLFPEAKESISYTMPAFKINKTYIYMASYKNHIGMYPFYDLDEVEDELSKYRTKGSKGTLHFPYSKPLPVDLIEKIVKLKMA